MELTTFWPDEGYRTPESNKISFRRRFFLGTRMSYHSMFMGIVRDMWWLAKRGKMTYVEYVDASSRFLYGIEQEGGILNIEGKEQLKDSSGPFVFVANHMGTLETQALQAVISPIEVSIVAKESLLTTPFFGKIIQNANPIPVGRRHPGEDLRTVLEKGKEYLDRGISVLLFPEGTRSLSFDPKKFNSLGMKLATHAGVEYVPIALKTDFWGTGALSKSFGPIRPKKEVHFAFGKPYKPTGRGKTEHKEAVDFITDKLRSWGVEIVE